MPLLVRSFSTHAGVAWALLLLGIAASSPVPITDALASDIAPPPIVFLVLDELPESSLLGSDGEIDGVLYPNFARLASQSTRFTGVTTVAARTRDAIPAIVSGKLPGDTRQHPIAEDYPSSLFSMLRKDYLMNVVETESILLDDGRGRKVHERRLSAMRSDRNKGLEEDAAFRLFVRGVGPTARRAALQGRGSLHFAHIRLPRFPWHLTPDGTSYRPYLMYGIFADVWQDEAWWPEEAYRRHLLQLRFVDVLLGELLSALHAAGVFDDALIVVTADFGASFWPAESRRSLTTTDHPEDVLHVPLLVKRPGQSVSSIDPRPAQTIDLLPTVAGVLGGSLDFAVDGCSLFSRACDPLAARQVLEIDAHGHRRLTSYPLELTDRRTTLTHKLERIGSGTTPEKQYAFGPYASSVGQRVDRFERGPGPAGVATPDRQWLRRAGGVRGPRVVFALALDAPSDQPPFVAIVRDGVIETIVPAPVVRQGRVVAAMLPEKSVRGDSGEVSVFLIEGPPAAPRMTPLAFPGGAGARDSR